MRSYIEINLHQLEKNYYTILNKVNKKIIAVIKSNAYGHGLIPICQKLKQLGVNEFIVATLEEAITLRKKFSDIEIILLEPSSSFNELIKYQITLSNGSISYLKKVVKSNYPFSFHLKLETGLNRLGIEEKELIYCKKILAHSKLKLEGIYTHISSKNSHQKQVNLFYSLIKRFKNYQNLKIHINSSNYLVKDDFSTHYRVGLGLYGLINDSSLHPIMSLKAPVYRTKKIKKGDYVGYHDHLSEKNGYLLTIPLGYADGWVASRKTLARYKNVDLEQIGETCMDLLMLYSPIEIKEGEIIELISDSITFFELSKHYNESIYHLPTLLSYRIERKYI